MIFSLVLLLWLLASALAEYDAGDAAGYLRLNAVAVCEDRRIAGWTCGRQCSTTAALVENGSQVLIGPPPVYNLHGFVARLRREGSSSCVVAIAGTSFYNWRDIRADLEFWRTKWPTWSGSCADWCYGCEVMKGFASSYHELRDEIFASLEQLKCSAVTFTGHSLGGAIAVLASLEARACHNFTVSVWTYGMPRVGNLAFVEAYVSTAKQRQQSPPMWRITRDFDLIPQLPQTWLGYYHIPWAVRYWKHDTEKVICTEMYEDPDCTYAGGTMADHHNYFGVTGTDENQASLDCISQSALKTKRDQFFAWRAGFCTAMVFASLLCCGSCCGCCFLLCQGRQRLKFNPTEVQCHLLCDETDSSDSGKV